SAADGTKCTALQHSGVAQTAISNPPLNRSPVKRRVGVLIVHPGSRVRQLQIRYPGLNTSAQKAPWRVIAISLVFSGDFRGYDDHEMNWSAHHDDANDR